MSIDLSYYIARSSLASIFSNAISVQEDELIVEGKGIFENRMLAYDVLKQSKGKISSLDVDCLILDFIDERFPLLKISDSVVTKSNYLSGAKYFSKLDEGRVKEISRDDPVSFELWKEGFNQLKKIIKGKKIVLHKAYWADKYMDHDKNEVKLFDAAKQKIVQKNNDFLNRLYSYVEANYDNLTVVEVDYNYRWSDFAHKWGVDYFHFGESYYAELAIKLEKAISS
ncbi:hypothetical protein HF888_03435 [Bermanella marisrubri]|nr:hypothetical protein HF888_03435 [Bermanella marisrubri]